MNDDAPPVSRQRSTAKPVHAPTKRAYGRGTGVPNPIDVHVGKRVSMRRRLSGMSQGSLAAALGLTFQQVQKYETGANRISASRLSQIAGILGVPVSYFFQGLRPDDKAGTAEERASRELMEGPEAISLIRFYYAIPHERVRRQFLEMVKAVAAQKTLQDGAPLPEAPARARGGRRVRR